MVYIINRARLFTPNYQPINYGLERRSHCPHVLIVGGVDKKAAQRPTKVIDWRVAAKSEGEEKAY